MSHFGTVLLLVLTALPVRSYGHNDHLADVSDTSKKSSVIPSMDAHLNAETELIRERVKSGRDACESSKLAKETCKQIEATFKSQPDIKKLSCVERAQILYGKSLMDARQFCIGKS